MNDRKSYMNDVKRQQSSSMVESMDETFEKKGYDAWIELWCEYESAPTLRDCPARYMEAGTLRTAFLRGWNRAKNEHAQNKK